MSVFGEVFGGGFPKDAARLEHERILAAALNPLFHLLSGDGFRTARAAQRNLLTHFNAAAGLDDDLSAAGELHV